MHLDHLTFNVIIGTLGLTYVYHVSFLFVLCFVFVFPAFLWVLEHFLEFHLDLSIVFCSVSLVALDFILAILYLVYHSLLVSFFF